MNRNIPADTDEHASAELLGDTGGRSVSAECLGGRTKVKQDTARNAHGSRGGIELDAGVARSRAHGPRRAKRTVRDLFKIAVVSEGRHGIADCGIDGPLRHVRHPHRHCQNLEQQRRDVGDPPGLPMEVGQLGIASKSTAGQVEFVHLCAEHRLSSICLGSACVRNHHGRCRSQCAERTCLQRQAPGAVCSP